MLTDYATQQILKNLTGKSSSINLASNCYVGLSSTAPQKNGTGVTEPSTGGYVRHLLGTTGTTAVQDMGEPTNGAITNRREFHFNKATADWGAQLTHFCIFDAETNGHLIAAGVLTTPITVAANTVAVIQTGELTITIE